MDKAFVSWPSAPLTKSLVERSLSETNPDIQIVSDIHEWDISPQKHRLLQFSTYDQIDHERTLIHPSQCFASSYIIRKALIRKHYLSRTIKLYVTKHPDSLLTKAAPQTFEMELSFADELDELLADDLWELNNSFENGSKQWWILKPLSVVCVKD